ncbi:class I SAM-dependent methyltransferase [Metabacillus herbersteinensis]|uniref:Class I SAM-dependent methyltransferase n=1 Tax=Metabacillus herbersteinensis TaxID=283816 RepID=A0ABV6GL49_9BACI
MLKKFKKSFSKPKGFLGIVAGKIMAWENQTINKWTIAQLHIQRGDNILEVGFGPAYSMVFILNTYQDVQIDGIDVSEAMKNLAESKLEKEMIEGTVELYVSDIEKAQLKQEHYHKILSVNNYTIWNYPRRGLEVLMKSLKPGGKVAITMQPREENASSGKTRMFGKQIHDDLVACGFHEIKMDFKNVRPELTVCITAVKPTN